MDVPYTKWELMLAVHSAGEKLIDKEKELEDIREKINAKFAMEPKNKMKAIAEYVGISIEALINSPNMDKLIVKYDLHILASFRECLKTELDLTDKECWAMVVGMFNPSALDLGD
jgi:hypothetical protein